MHRFITCYWSTCPTNKTKGLPEGFGISHHPLWYNYAHKKLDLSLIITEFTYELIEVINLPFSFHFKA